MSNVKVDLSKLTLSPVPDGLKMRIHHVYQKGPDRQIRTMSGAVSVEEGPSRLVRTLASLVAEDGTEVAKAESIVNPKDNPIKKLGRVIAHNRCIKAYGKEKAKIIAAEVA